MTTLRPLRDDEYDAWAARAEAGYAWSIEHEGGVDHDAALAKATTDVAALLSDRLETADHSVFAVEDDARPLGSLWVAERELETGRALFVYALEIDEAFRGQGHGRAAMRLAEDEARRRGLDSVTLNVFGGNAAARGLYRSLGYEETAVFMRRHVG